jgi:transglutaminase-like putative cysteine protease
VIDDEVRVRARQATAGRRTRMAQARGIYDYVRQVMTYDKTTPGWGRGDTRRACLLGKGNCTDFHSLFISMARAQQIPARFKIGVVIPQQSSGVVAGYHCWAEFYVPGRGWIPVDASEAWKHPERADDYFGAHDPNRLLISVGRDLRLTPRQRGQPANLFFAPYVEVDGRTFLDVGVEVRFTDLQQGRTT